MIVKRILFLSMAMSGSVHAAEASVAVTARKTWRDGERLEWNKVQEFREISAESMTVMPDDKSVLVGMRPKKILSQLAILDREKGDIRHLKRVCEISHWSFGVVGAIACLTETSCVCGLRDGRLFTYDITREETLGRFGGEERSRSSHASLAVTPDKNTLVAAVGDRAVEVWDIRSNKFVAILPDKEEEKKQYQEPFYPTHFLSVGILNDVTIVASGENLINVWDLRNLEKPAKKLVLPTKSGVIPFEVLSEKTIVAKSWLPKSLIAVDTEKGGTRELGKNYYSSDFITRMSAVRVAAQSKDDGTVEVFDVETGIHNCLPTSGDIWSCCATGDGCLLTSGLLKNKEITAVWKEMPRK